MFKSNKFYLQKKFIQSSIVSILRTKQIQRKNKNLKKNSHAFTKNKIKNQKNFERKS